ncbi:LOW QUALITY PROTEIN: hypothetical protein RJ640_030217 [Escallonia rubra]|uniref:CCHC-type domain-containing protein n=1 Tax=Escallonia rubra TaxID=112253 RepID=A0AA88RPP2_9ASTE|nr:LOW QUALITY PROTEIN: hypothetical protein RJ640_030217 [Escallonia rubra]
MDNIITQTRSLLCEDFIELEADNLNATMEAALTLVVKAITTKTIPLKPLQNILLKAWKPLKGMKVQHIQGNIFSVTFNHEWDRKRIMDSRPWSIMSSHLVVRDWPSDRAIEELSFDYSPFWIRIFGLPPNQMMKINAEKIGAKIGKVLDIDFTSDGKISWNKFLRIQVELNITTPLHSGFHRSKATNTKSWISLRYERLPDFCFNCGRLGHVQRGCVFQPITMEALRTTPFGPWLRAEHEGNCPMGAEWNPNLSENSTASEPEAPLVTTGRRHPVQETVSSSFKAAPSPSDTFQSHQHPLPDTPPNQTKPIPPFFPNFKPIPFPAKSPNPTYPVPRTERDLAPNHTQ